MGAIVSEGVVRDDCLARARLEQLEPILIELPVGDGCWCIDVHEGEGEQLLSDRSDIDPEYPLGNEGAGGRVVNGLAGLVEGAVFFGCGVGGVGDGNIVTPRDPLCVAGREEDVESGGRGDLEG